MDKDGLVCHILLQKIVKKGEFKNLRVPIQNYADLMH